LATIYDPVVSEERADVAWRAGARLFEEVWPLILARVEPGEFRQEFVRDLLALFLGCDVDPTDLKSLHPEVDRALRELGEVDEGDQHPVDPGA
jgi:hypothetical protein